MRNLILLGLALAIGSPALAEDKPITWKDDVAGWYVGVDTSIGNGCFMTASYEAGTFLRVQFNPQDDNFQFIVGDGDWSSLEDGKAYDIEIAFGSRSPWSGEATGGRIGDLPTLTLDVPFDKDKAAAFIDEFRRMTSVAITYQSKEIARLELSGTNAGMEEVINCQAAVNENQDASPAADPFQSGGAKAGGADPFN